MSKYVIVNSDDYGIYEGVNRGIIEAHHRGIVTSTSVMTNMPPAVEGVPKAKREAPRLGLGLHLTLSYGRPVAEDVPSLVMADGNFCSTWGQLMEKMATFTAEDLDKELTAQFNRFVELAGHPPDKIDSHHRAAYMHPEAFEVMCRLAAEHRIPIRKPNWLDGDSYQNLSTNADGRLIEKLKAIVEKYRPRWPQFLLDPIFIWENAPRVSQLLAAINSLQEGTSEIVCHVGYGEGLNEDYNTQRNYDLAAVTDPAVRAQVQQMGIQLITFGDLPG